MEAKRTYIIAEAGVNHNGNPELAFQLIDAAKKAGADAVKFQTFKAEAVVSEHAEKAEYQKNTTTPRESQIAMLRRLEISYELHEQLLEYSKKNGIEFLSTAFDMDSLRFLVKGLQLQTLKIPSGEITNAPLILEYAKTGCNLIVSTGMATLAEVESVLSVIAFGMIAPGGEEPCINAFYRAYFSEEGQCALKTRVKLLHCTTEYPAPPTDINLAAMDTLQHAFGLTIGYSDHSEGITVPIAAVARGAKLIEKHFTLDKRLDGPDHRASLDPRELKLMIDSIRLVEASIGDGVKGPRPSELKNIAAARKSLVASIDIQRGAVFCEDNIAVKRPGNGISPMEYWNILGKKSKRSFKKGDLICD